MIEALLALSPTQFENLTYDLVSSAGLRNPVWRTPGADTGRDIEGEIISVDFSGFLGVSRWYVECKRYTATVDWPTVWEKISYADSHGADFLLLVTTAFLSPQCKSEISNWNRSRRRPAIRVWDATNIGQVLLQHPHVLVKYALARDDRLIPPSFLTLAREMSKVVQAAYGTAETKDQENPALETASALSELLTVRMADAEAGKEFQNYPFSVAEDAYIWLAWDGIIDELLAFDRYGLRAILTTIRHVGGLQTVPIAVDHKTLYVSLAGGKVLSTSGIQLLTEISTWGDVEFSLSEGTVTLRARGGDDPA